MVKNCGVNLPEILATKKNTVGQFQRRKPQKQIAVREVSATLKKMVSGDFLELPR